MQAAMAACSDSRALLLQAEGIVKRYGGNEVLKSVSVQARQGDVMSMIGSSGSDKRTFLRCLSTQVAIGRALAMEPQVMLFDEPTSVLAPELVGEVPTRPRSERLQPFLANSFRWRTEATATAGRHRAAARLPYTRRHERPRFGAAPHHAPPASRRRA